MEAKKDEGETNSSKLDSSTDNEIKLLFLGSFYHESENNVNADLIQFKEPTQVTEVRVIPLGANVQLSNGSVQLGATNPSELNLQFYYNDIQYPSKSFFELLTDFEFNDKTKINYTCNPEVKVITDGLVVLGKYAIITLAVYGHTVDDVPIKEIEKKVEASDAQQSIDLSEESEKPCEGRKTEEKFDALKSSIQIQEGLERLEAFPTDENNTYDDDSNMTKTHTNIEADDQSVSTVEVKSDAISSPCVTKENEAPVTIVDRKRQRSNSLCEEDPEVKKRKDDDIAEIIIEDAEEISDGDISGPEEHEDVPMDMEHMEIIDEVTSPASMSPGKDLLDIEGEEISPTNDLSDADEIESEAQAGFEEIVSDDEIPDYNEYEDFVDSEWEECWAPKFIKCFNPFDDKMKLKPLQALFLDPYKMSDSSLNADESLKKVQKYCQTYRQSEFDPSNSEMMESWIEVLENITTYFPKLFEYSNEENLAEVVDTLLFWISQGLDFDLARSHKTLAYKVRHIKAGVNLLKSCVVFGGEILIDKLLGLKVLTENNSEVSIINKLLDVLVSPYMNVVTKLLAIRTLDNILVFRKGYLKFISCEESKPSCYQKLVDMSLDAGFSTRVTYAIRCILKRVNVMQLLNNLPSSDGENLQSVLMEILSCARHVDHYFSQPLRILPANYVVELPCCGEQGSEQRYLFMKMLSEMDFFWCCGEQFLEKRELLVQSWSVMTEILLTLINWEAGVQYLLESAFSLTELLKLLSCIPEGDDRLVYILYSLHALMLCDSLFVNGGVKANFENVHDDTQMLYSFLRNAVGKSALADILSKGNIIPRLLSIIKDSYENSLEPLEAFKYTAVRGYLVDIVTHVVRQTTNIHFMNKFGGDIYKTIDAFKYDQEGAEKLKEVLLVLKPTLNPLFFTTDGIDMLCELVKTKAEEFSTQPAKLFQDSWGFPMELITAIKILHFLGVSDVDCDLDRVFYCEPDAKIKELKYDIALVKMHLAGLLSSFMTIFQKIITLFSNHGSRFYEVALLKGETIVLVLLPMVKIFSKLLSKVIKVRGTDFKDTTAVPVLLELYGIMSLHLQKCYTRKAKEIKQNIVGALLTYTVPAMKQGLESEDELNKSAWSSIVANIIKYTLSTPSAFLPGLEIFSEILPLPLPIPCAEELTAEECAENVKLRRLWCAYIHGLSPQIQELIYMFSSTAHSRLSFFLKRICIQLSDLSASTCLVVCRSLLDSLMESIEMKDSTMEVVNSSISDATTVSNWMENSSKLALCSQQTLRQLYLIFSVISRSAVIKNGMMQVLRGATKLDEKYSEVLIQLGALLNVAYKDDEKSKLHIECLEHIVSIFQSFCDPELSMQLPMYGKSVKTLDAAEVLQNSLPSKDHLSLICGALLRCLNSIEKNETVVRLTLDILRTLEVIALTDIGLNSLRISLKSFPGIFSRLFFTFFQPSTKDTEVSEVYWPLLPGLVGFLTTLVSSPTPGSDSVFPPRTFNLSKDEFMALIRTQVSYQMEEKLGASDTSYDECKAFCHNLKDQLEEALKVTVLNNNEEFQIEIEKAFISVDELITFVNSEPRKSMAPEQPIFHCPDLLVDLFTNRPVYVVVNQKFTNRSDYWLTSFPEDFLNDDFEVSIKDLDSCDAIKLCNTYLNGLDPVQEMEKLMKSSELSKEPQKSKSINQLNQRQDILSVPIIGAAPFKATYGPGRGLGSRGGFSGRGLLQNTGRGPFDLFRSRPPNTSRPPSLHVDDFEALESTGQMASSSPGFTKGPVPTRVPIDPYANRTRLMGSSRPSYSMNQQQPLMTGRNAPMSPQDGFYSPNPRNEAMMHRGRGNRPNNRSRNRSMVGPGRDRWADERSHGGYEDHSRMQPYGDKFRPMAGARSPQAPMSRHSPQYSRPVYREAPPTNRRSLSPSASQRWRDRHKTTGR